MSGEEECPACVQIGVNLPMLPPPHICTGRPGCLRAELREAEEAMRRGDRATTGPATEPHPAAGTAGGADSGATPIIPDETIAALEEGAFLASDSLVVALSVGMRVSPAIAQEAADEITRLRAEVERLTKERDDPVMVALRRVRSGEAAGYMGPEVVILSRAQHDSDHEVVVRLRAENARLTTERDEAKAHHVRWVEEVDADLAEIEANMDQQDADRHARDVAMVKAWIEEAAKLHDDHADRLAESARRYRANTGEPDGPRIHAAEDHRENAKAIRAIDPEAVLKAMEGGR